VRARLFYAAVLFGCSVAFAAEKWQPVPPPDFSKIRLDDFTDEELDFPYYLNLFPKLANSIVEDGPERGFVGEVF